MARLERKREGTDRHQRTTGRSSPDVAHGRAINSPSTEAVQPLHPRQAHKLERRLALKVLIVRNDIARRLQIPPAVRHDGASCMFLCRPREDIVIV